MFSTMSACLYVCMFVYVSGWLYVWMSVTSASQRTATTAAAAAASAAAASDAERFVGRISLIPHIPASGSHQVSKCGQAKPNQPNSAI